MQSNADPIFSVLPKDARIWLEKLPWAQRRYVLLLCHLVSACPHQLRAEFLDDYTADGLISRVIQDLDTQQKVRHYLDKFHIETELTETVLHNYIQQFYMHSAQDARQQTDLYLESVLKLMINSQEKFSMFNYVMGFELIQMMFCMSWAQQERLYCLQIGQENFVRQYIKPIQFAHRINGIIVPRNKDQFFAHRNYFIKRPRLAGKRLVALVMATFTTKTVTEFGFSVIRTPNAFQFDYDYIFGSEPTDIVR